MLSTTAVGIGHMGTNLEGCVQVDRARAMARSVQQSDVVEALLVSVLHDGDAVRALMSADWVCEWDAWKKLDASDNVSCEDFVADCSRAASA